MLGNAKTSTTIPVVDMERALNFYTNTLGLKVDSNDDGGTLLSTSNHGSIVLYTRGATTADHTVCSFEVTDFDAVMSGLREAGVSFHDYDFPGLKTENGVATLGETRKAAWFNDTEGNILSVGNMA